MDDDPDGDGEASTDRSGRRSSRPHGVPWTRALLCIAVGGPALYFGGTRPETVIAFVPVVFVLWLRLCTRSTGSLAVPQATWLGVLIVGVTFVQWVPLHGLREALAPSIAAQVDAALVHTTAEPWPGLSPTPGDTGLEVARLVALVALFVTAAQLSWRTSAAMVAGTGTLVALVGFTHEALGLDAIYGRYAAEDVDLAGVPALLTTFVNANHQSSLLLLGAFAAGALALDQHIAGLATRDPAKVDRHGDRSLAALAALGIQVPALVLSLSRAALVSLAIVGPIALWLGLRRDSRRKTRAKRQRHMTPLRYVGLLGSLGILILVAQHGAWRELGTLSDVASRESQSANKLRMIGEVPALLEQSPVLGIGRGAFVDLRPPVAPEPSHVLYTHLESAPAAAIVEWGPWFGGTLLLGLAWWGWSAWRRDPERRDITPRRIALLGLLAMALQNGADFALDFLGVAAPAIALAGGLSPMRREAWPLRRAALAVGLLLVGAFALAVVSAPNAYARREAANRAMQRGELDPVALFRVRPLDGRLHGLVAREAARNGDWQAARTRAIVATQRLPGAIDGWLLRAAAEHALGNAAAADAAMTEALERLHETPADELRDWLLARHPDPAQLAVLVPRDRAAWQHLVDALEPVAPAHADALSAAYALEHPTDPAPLRMRAILAMRRDDPALALHHARLWRQLAPNSAGAHRAVALALRAARPARLADARDALEDALAHTTFPSQAEHAVLETVLLQTLLDLGDEVSRARAREIAEILRKRPADRGTQKQREPLLREALSSDPPADDAG